MSCADPCNFPTAPEHSCQCSLQCHSLAAWLQKQGIPMKPRKTMPKTGAPSLLYSGWLATFPAPVTHRYHSAQFITSYLPSAPGLSCWLLACSSPSEQCWESVEEEEEEGR